MRRHIFRINLFHMPATSISTVRVPKAWTGLPPNLCHRNQKVMCTPQFHLSTSQARHYQRWGKATLPSRGTHKTNTAS
jgi:hypothetical protein